MLITFFISGFTSGSVVTVSCWERFFFQIFATVIVFLNFLSCLFLAPEWIPYEAFGRISDVLRPLPIRVGTVNCEDLLRSQASQLHPFSAWGRFPRGGDPLPSPGSAGLKSHWRVGLHRHWDPSQMEATIPDLL